MLCTEKVSEMYGDGRESGEQMNVRKGDEKRKCGGWAGKGRILKIRNIYYHFVLFVMKNHLLLPNYWSSLLFAQNVVQGGTGGRPGMG